MTASLLPVIKARFFDANNNPLSFGKVYAYQAGSQVFQDTFKEFSANAGSKNTNPVELNIEGSADIWLSDGLPYKIVVDDSEGNLRYSADNVVVNASIGGGSAIGTVFISSLDPVAGFLSDKLLAGENITLDITTNISGDNMTVAIADNPSFTGDTTSDTFNGGTLSGDNTGDQDLTGFVPYVGATANLDLGFNSLIVDNILSDTQFNVNIDNSQILSVDKNTVFTTPSISFRSDKVQTPLLGTANTSTPLVIQVGSSEKIEVTDVLTTIKTDAEIQGELKLNSNITFLQASQAVISGASIAINTGAFRLVGNGISYDGSTFVAPEITASTKLWSDGDIEGSGDLIIDDSGTFGGDVNVTNGSLQSRTVGGDVTSLQLYHSNADGDAVKSRTYVSSTNAPSSVNGAWSSWSSVADTSFPGYIRNYLGTGGKFTIYDPIGDERASIDTGGNFVTTGTSKVNGATNFGRLSTAPTPLAGGDSYYNTTNNIPYIWDGTDWLELTAGSSFGQLRTTRNTTAQTGIISTFTKVTQYTTNGIEEGSVSVDLPNDTMTLGDGIYEFYFGHDMTTTSSTVVMTFGVFDVTDTTFSNPYLEINRKIGTGSDVGAMGLSGLDTIVGTTEIALFVKADKNTDMTLTNATLKVIKIK